jgi:hypothetical protein
MAPDPFVPEGSTPVKVTTVIDDATLCERFAVTVALLSAEVEKARQISASPGCAFVRFTRAQVNPPPATLVTVVPPDDAESVETKARHSSFGAVVENAGVVIDVLAEAPSRETVASMANCPGGEIAVTSNVRDVVWLKLPLVAVTVKG